MPIMPVAKSALARQAERARLADAEAFVRKALAIFGQQESDEVVRRQGLKVYRAMRAIRRKRRKP